MIHRTRPDDARIHDSGWAILPSGIEVTRVPLLDWAHTTDDRMGDADPLFARLTYADALLVADRENARLVSDDTVKELHLVGLELAPYFGTPVAEIDIVHSIAHDKDMWEQLRLHRWDGAQPVANCGKHWVAGAPPGRSRLMGWWSAGKGSWWQPLAVAHNRAHHDDGTTTLLERDSAAERPTKEMPPAISHPGDKGQGVRAWQEYLYHQGYSPGPLDGIHGGQTERATEAWLKDRGIARSQVRPTTSLGPPPPSQRMVQESSSVEGQGGTTKTYAVLTHDPRAPACVAALRDADAHWPRRSKVSDGIMGDARHQATVSDHNAGEAVDITHDIGSGCTGSIISQLAMQDPRVKYIIWNARIWSRARAAEGWRLYSGSNLHKHHCHISVRHELRSDDSKWPWAP